VPEGAECHVICRECRTAAGLTRETEVIYQYLDGREQEMLTGAGASELMHKECPGDTWCDCQHKLPAHPVPG
jgi:hypothetical protein